MNDIHPTMTRAGTREWSITECLGCTSLPFAAWTTGVGGKKVIGFYESMDSANEAITRHLHARARTTKVSA